MAVSAADVKRLREMTNAPMMDCKAALDKAGGDMAKAQQILKEQNKIIAGKKAEREAAEGRIAVYIDAAKAIAALVELRCESAPVAKSEPFVLLANDLAKHIVSTGETASGVDALLSQKYEARTVRDRIEDVVGLIRENMKPARFAKLTGGQFGSYIHFDGTVGVLLQVEGEKAADPVMLKDICMHIAAKQPVSGRREDVPQQLIDSEREVARNQAAQTGKPAKIVEMIAEGKLKTWFAENVLVEQPFVKDDTKTVGDLLKSAGVTLKQFIRYKVGELAKS